MCIYHRNYSFLKPAIFLILLVVYAPLSSLAHYELSHCDTVLYKKSGKLLKTVLDENHIYWYIQELRNLWQYSEGGEGISNESISVADYLKHVNSEREGLAEQLSELKELSTNHALVKNINDSQKDIKKYDFTAKQALDAEELQHLPFWDLQDFFPSLSPKKIFTTSFYGFRSLVIGNLAELQVAALVKSLVAMNDYTFNLLTREQKAHIRKIKGVKKASWLLNFEIDLVFDHGHAWAEVKSIRNLSGKKSKLNEILDRAERLKWLVDYLNNNGKSIQLHYYFVGEHPGTQLERELRKLGLHVHYLGD